MRAGDASAIEETTVCLIDELRASHHLRPLRANRYLREVAGAQLDEMLRWDYFADVGPFGQTPFALIASSHYGEHARVLAGQNLGWGTGIEASPRRMVAAWMRSAAHRAIMLSRAFRDIGVSVATTLPAVLAHGRSGAIYAVEFAARRPARAGPRARAHRSQ